MRLNGELLRRLKRVDVKRSSALKKKVSNPQNRLPLLNMLTFVALVTSETFPVGG
jgi:hypothetical protein